MQILKTTDPVRCKLAIVRLTANRRAALQCPKNSGDDRLRNDNDIVQNDDGETAMLFRFVSSPFRCVALGIIAPCHFYVTDAVSAWCHRSYLY